MTICMMRIQVASLYTTDLELVTLPVFPAFKPTFYETISIDFTLPRWYI